MSIQEELKRLREEMGELRRNAARSSRSVEQYRKKVERLERESERLRDEKRALEEENGGLKDEIASLRAHRDRLAGMLFKKNAKAAQAEIPGERRARGARSGHAGHARKIPERVDRERAVHLTRCPDCHGRLARSSSFDERVVEDIPDARTVTTRYSVERQWCRKCRKEVRALPEDTLPGMRVGLRAVVLICLLRYRLRTPLGRISEMLGIQHGLSLTTAGIQGILRALSKRFSRQYEIILKAVRDAPVKHADETSWRIRGQNGWCWLFATEDAALYTIEESRGGGVPRRVLGPGPEGVLVRDDYGGYGCLETMEHQSCWAHLLRVSHDAARQPSASSAMREFHEELKAMFREIDALVQARHAAGKRREFHGLFAKRLRAVEERAYAEKDARAVQTRIRNQGDNLITALLRPGVPLTNNHAERQIRPVAVMRKISGGSRSLKGAAVHAVNMSVMQTISLQGKDYPEELRRLLVPPTPHAALGNGE